MIVLVIFLVTLLYPFTLAHDESLELLVVLFRHGDRTNDDGTNYPKNPYYNFTYYPYGRGEITDIGKQRSFDFGRQLKNIYEKYLNSINPNEISGITTEYNRTKTTLRFVLKGLFLENKINTNNWYKYLNFTVKPTKSDRLLSFPYIHCPRYQRLFNDYERLEEKIVNKYIRQFPFVQEHTGTNIKHLYNLYLLYFGLQVDQEWGLALPEWASNVSLKYFESAALDFYKMSVMVPEFNRLFGGHLLKETLNSMDLTARKLNNYRLYLYSGHEINIVGLLGALNVFDPHKIPYLASVVMELHNINSTFYVKVFHYQNQTEGFKQMKIPGCDILCSLESMKQILQENMPEDSTTCDD